MCKELLLSGRHGVADLAATARIRNGLMKFWELLPFLISRAPSRDNNNNNIYLKTYIKTSSRDCAYKLI